MAIRGLGGCCCDDRCRNGYPTAAGPQSGTVTRTSPWYTLGPIQRAAVDSPLTVGFTLGDWTPIILRNSASNYWFAYAGLNQYVAYRSVPFSGSSAAVARLFRVEFVSSWYVGPQPPFTPAPYSWFSIYSGGHDSQYAGAFASPGTLLYRENLPIGTLDFNAAGEYKANVTSGGVVSPVSFSLSTPFITTATTATVLNWNMGSGTTQCEICATCHCYIPTSEPLGLNIITQEPAMPFTAHHITS